MVHMCTVVYCASLIKIYVRVLKPLCIHRGALDATNLTGNFLQSLTVSIREAVERVDEKGKKFTAYTIDVTFESTKWQVERR